MDNHTPDEQWDQVINKRFAIAERIALGVAGVSLLASVFIWRFHETLAGNEDWQGNPIKKIIIIPEKDPNALIDQSENHADRFIK